MNHFYSTCEESGCVGASRLVKYSEVIGVAVVHTVSTDIDDRILRSTSYNDSLWSLNISGFKHRHSSREARTVWDTDSHHFIVLENVSSTQTHS